MKRISKKWTAAAAVAAVAIGVTGFGLQAANADGGSFAVYDEADSPNPYSVTNGLVFYKAADLGWSVNKPISDVKSLAYTVADGTSYAPSFQLVTKSDQKSYARLVWEPYMQKDSTADFPNAGTYTDLQNGLWWTNKIPSGAGSQSDPQPLSFFTESAADGGAGWTNVVVSAVDVHQGTTTDATHVVTKVDYNGTDIALGNADITPFNQADVDKSAADAAKPLNDRITEKNGQISDLNGQLDAKNDEIAQLNETIDSLNDAKGATEAVNKLTDQVTALVSQITTLQGKIDDLKGQVSELKGQLADKDATIKSLKDQVSDLSKYKASHHTADNTYLGESRALLSGTPVHGKTVGITKSGSIAKATSVKYQWYVSGKAVSGATHSTYKVPTSAKGRTISVKVTGTYKYIAFAVHSNTVAAK